MLFTADLRAFSERLVAKAEVKEEKEVVRVSQDGTVHVEDTAETRLVLEKREKREFEQEHQVLEVRDTVVRKSKRQKRV